MTPDFPLIEMFSFFEKMAEPLSILGRRADAFDALLQRFSIRGERESEIVVFFRPDSAKGLPVHGGHLIFIEQEHLEEGRGASLLLDLLWKVLKGIHHSQILTNISDVRKGIEGPFGLLATNPFDCIQAINNYIPPLLESGYHVANGILAEG